MIDTIITWIWAIIAIFSQDLDDTRRDELCSPAVDLATNYKTFYETQHEEIIVPQYIPNLYATWQEIQHIFARETDARVVDLATGLEFNVRRTFGTHHADVEPLTTEDADIMRYIWGGYSWARRSVAVYVAGQVFPASLTFFPHAGRDDAPALATVDNRSGGYGRGVNLDAVKGNGVCGIVCMHFYGSLLHGSLRSNPDHQNAVLRAREILQELR
ncbi:MAG: hypothetical protein FWE44_01215 [Defluviitaleaceae bacterium]|nr:hypothetical protein [Defluviitaleaceae bacterium]